MDDKVIMLVLVALLFVALTCALIAWIMLKKLKVKDSLKVELKGRKDLLYSAYVTAIKYSFLRKYIFRIRKRIELLDISDDWTISRKTMKITLTTVGITLLVFIALIFFISNLYYLIISIFTVYMLHNQIIKILVDRIENKLLRQFEDFLVNVRHHYHEHGMIDEAIYDSIEECDYEMSLHANRMYEILTATDVEEKVEQYNDNAPNKFMKTFMAICYLVQRFGDKTVDDKSIYLNNLNYLKQEINMELLKREKLGYLFQSLSTIAVFPIFTLKPLENWAISNIPELKEYYNGAYGFCAVIILFLLVFVSYQLILRLQSSIEYIEQDNTLYTYLLKIPVLKNLTDGMIERNHTKAYKYDILIKKTGSKISVNQFYAKQILFSILTLIFSTGVFFNIHSIVRHNILNYSKNFYIAEFDNQINIEEELEIIKKDRKYILLFAGTEPTFEEIQRAMEEDGDYSRNQSGIAAIRVLNKLKTYNYHYFKWWELVIALVLSAIAYNIPLWMLKFRERVLRMNMEDEVMQFHSIILMLMHIERVNVEDVLNWMEQFAEIFKSSISKCINDYEYGDIAALEQLIQDEPYKPFVRIVENLKSAEDKITIEHAFDELKTEREYYQEKRKQDNEILVNKKGMWGKLIAFIPFGATVLLYLIIPFILVSVSHLMGYTEEINQVI
ncbi:MAG: hypothetical protein GX045_01310 [Clostridiaceae bacterium]|nr:hypothetical protein [Clostridiaceae bacterium]